MNNWRDDLFRCWDLNFVKMTIEKNNFWGIEAANLKAAIELYESKNGVLDLADQSGAINVLHSNPSVSSLVHNIKNLVDKGGETQLSGLFAVLDQMRLMETTFDFNQLTEEQRLQYCQKCLAQEHPDVSFEINLSETELCDCCGKLNDVANPTFLVYAKEKGIDSHYWLMSGKDRVFRNPISQFERIMKYMYCCPKTCIKVG